MVEARSLTRRTVRAPGGDWMSRRIRWSSVIAAVATIGCLAAAAVPWSSPGLAAEPRTFIWGKSGDADTLDVNVTGNGEAWEVAAQIFNLLVRTKPGATDIEPDLATSWSVSPDGLIWTFKLRQGVTFQDGTPWNADAAKFNFDRWADEKNPYHLVQGYDYTYWKGFLADSFSEARAVDPYTLQLVLKQPNGPLLQNLAIIAFGFNSPTAIKLYGARDLGQHPVGTGPYRLTEWVRDDHVKVVQSDPSFKLGYRPPFNTGWFRFNMNNPLFKDKRVREAITMAINRRA